MSRKTSDQDLINELIYVKKCDGKFCGWKLSLLQQGITSKTDELFLTCSVCRGLLRDACLVEKDGKQEVRCNACISPGLTHTSAQMNRFAVDQKYVNCPYKGKGCYWGNLITRLQYHLSTSCQFFPVLCPQNCTSEVDGKREFTRIERRLLASHQRDSCKMTNCGFCTKRIKPSEMKEHLRTCEYFLIQCPNKCRDDSGVSRHLKRKDIWTHLYDECPLNETVCPYLEYGCDVVTQRRMLETHEKDFMHTHFKMTMTGMKRVQDEQLERIKILEKENKKLKSDFDSAISSMSISKGIVDWKIEHVRQRIDNSEECSSDPFYAGLYKLQGFIQWNSQNKGNVGCFIRLLKGEWDDLVDWPFKFKSTFILINQLNNCENYVRLSECTKDVLQVSAAFQKPRGQSNPATGLQAYISHSEMLKGKYSGGDSIILKIIVERVKDEQ